MVPNDTAIYSGAQTDYTMTNNAMELTVTHDSSGDANTLSNVEDLSFVATSNTAAVATTMLYHFKIYHPLTQHLNLSRWWKYSNCHYLR